MARSWAERFESTFAGQVSAVDQRICREAYGDEYPEGVEPFSFVSRTELERFVVETGVARDGVLVDVGCGRGGPGLWVAAHVGATLVGVDIAHAALLAATARAASLGFGDAGFVRGGFDALPLAATGADALMSVDSLLFATDKAAAVRELARILRPGGRLVLTSWDYRTQPPGRPPQVDDHRPLLRDAGLRILAYEETVDWYERQRRIDELTLAAVDELAAESGADPAMLRADLEEEQATTATMLRRVLMVAERR